MWRSGFIWLSLETGLILEPTYTQLHDQYSYKIFPLCREKAFRFANNYFVNTKKIKVFTKAKRKEIYPGWSFLFCVFPVIYFWGPSFWLATHLCISIEFWWTSIIFFYCFYYFHGIYQILPRALHLENFTPPTTLLRAALYFIFTSPLSFSDLFWNFWHRK